MADDIFSQINAKAGGKDRSPQWYAQTVNQLARGVDTINAAAKTDLGNYVSKMQPGEMYLFMYDPKGKETLPYYDRFPLVLPFDTTPGGFIGLNFHYLPPLLRAKLLDKLLPTAGAIDETSRMKVNWGVLQNFGRYPEAKPCVKKYLTGHMKTRLFRINPEYWKTSIYLPTIDFRKASTRTVWKDSKGMM